VLQFSPGGQSLATALCATGQADEGLAILQRLLPKRREELSASSPGLASMRANMGLCALAAGQLQLAREASALASAAIASQPDVAEFWKEPVRELERRLRHR